MNFSTEILLHFTSENLVNELHDWIEKHPHNIPISIDPVLMDYLVPTEDNIEWAMKRLHNHRSRGPSRMRAEHLKGWSAAAMKKDKEEAAAEQEKPTEGGTIPGPGRTRREGKEESIEKTSVETSN